MKRNIYCEAGISTPLSFGKADLVRDTSLPQKSITTTKEDLSFAGKNSQVFVIHSLGVDFFRHKLGGDEDRGMADLKRQGVFE